MAWALADSALAGVGDAQLGEWREVGARTPVAHTVHVRRRMADKERAGLQVRDIRGTPEEAQRQARLLRAAPHLGPVLRSAGLLR